MLQGIVDLKILAMDPWDPWDPGDDATNPIIHFAS